MSESTMPRWSEATDALARHRATESPTHCDACSLRWPCDTYTLAASHETLLVACEEIASICRWGIEGNDDLENREAVARIARAAIARARGES